MERKALSVPEIGIISGTRAALGAGLGLLLADRLSDAQRRAVGWTLFLVGAISTIPIALQLFRDEQGHAMEHESAGHRLSNEFEQVPTGIGP